VQKEEKKQQKGVRTDWVGFELGKVLQRPSCTCRNLFPPSLALVVLQHEMSASNGTIGCRLTSILDFSREAVS